MSETGNLRTDTISIYLLFSTNMIIVKQ